MMGGWEVEGGDRSRWMRGGGDRDRWGIVELRNWGKEGRGIGREEG